MARQVAQPLFVLCRAPSRETRAPHGAPSRASSLQRRAALYGCRPFLPPAFAFCREAHGGRSAPGWPCSWRAARSGRQTVPDAARVRDLLVTPAGAVPLHTSRRNRFASPVGADVGDIVLNRNIVKNDKSEKSRAGLNFVGTRRDEGMLSFDESVRQLLQAGRISWEIAERNVRDPSMLRR